MELMLEKLKQNGKYRKIVLWYTDGNDAAKHLHEHMGFSEAGSIQDEIGMQRLL